MMGGETKKEGQRNDALIALKEIERLLNMSNNNNNNNNNSNNNNNNSDQSQDNNVNEYNSNNNNMNRSPDNNALLQTFLHLERSGMSYRFGKNTSTNRNKNDEHNKTNNLITTLKKRKNSTSTTKSYSRLRKRKEVTYLGRLQLIGILSSVLLSILLCFGGIRTFLWIVPNVHLGIRYTFEYAFPNLISKETNLNTNVLSVTTNITAKVFFDDYMKKKVPILFTSRTVNEELRKDLLGLIDGQYKHTPVAISSIEKVAKDRLIPSSVSITTYSAKSKLSDIRRQGRFDINSHNDNVIVSENVFNNGRLPKILKLVSSSRISLPDCINTTDSHCTSVNYIDLFPDYKQSEVYLTYSVNGTGINFHYHRESWSLLLKGKMKWVVFPPDMVASGGFDPKTDNLKKWMNEVYTKLRKSQRPYILNQNEGEIIYIPEGYYYSTITTTKESISISQMSSFEQAGGFLSYRIDGLKRYSAGDYKGAITSFSLGSKVVYDFSLLYDQALCYEALSDYKQAESLYSQSLRKNPRFSPAYEKLIRLHLSNNKTSTDGYSRAKELIDNAILANIVDNNKILMDLKLEIDTYTSSKQV